MEMRLEREREGDNCPSPICNLHYCTIMTVIGQILLFSISIFFTIINAVLTSTVPNILY